MTKQDHYIQSNYPTDSDWVACGYGANVNYPLIYFPNVANANAVTVRISSESVSVSVLQPGPLR